MSLTPSPLIPLDLDLRALPGVAAQVTVEVDLGAVLAHTLAGAASGDLPAVTARLEDRRVLPAQLHRGPLPAVSIALPADVAAREGVRVLLAVEERAARPRVVLSQGAQNVELWLEGERFALYRYNTADPDLPRPYFHPVQGATGQPITQDGEIPGTRQAHFHHTGLVLAHQNFTDGNNWQIGPNFSRMRHLAFDVMESGPLQGRFVQRLEWPSATGDRVVFRETRTVTLPYRERGRRVLDVDTTVTCGERPAVWNATPYHLLAIRVPDAMTVARGGVLTNSEGVVTPRGGTPAKWLDFSGNLGGRCGVTLMDHPANPRHPTPWLNFEDETVGAAPTHNEPMPWEAGQSRRFRYRVYLHAGDAAEGRVADEYQAFTAVVPARVGPPVGVA